MFDEIRKQSITINRLNLEYLFIIGIFGSAFITSIFFTYIGYSEMQKAEFTIVMGVTTIAAILLYISERRKKNQENKECSIN